MQIEIREYVEDGRSPFAEWFDALAPAPAARVDRYIRRLQQGHFGTAKSLGGGLAELRIDTGPGYRVYFGRSGKTIVILLAGGSKRAQARDIKAARERWERCKKALKKGGT